MLEYDVIYEDESFRERADEDFVRKTVDSIAPEILGDEGLFSISFVGSGTITEENRSYRGIDAPTDILTFALCDSDDDFPIPEEEGATKEWGDMLICLDSMEENASSFGVPSSQELARLLVHGLLHLSGEDHSTNDFSSEPMLIRQEALLKRLGIC